MKSKAIKDLSQLNDSDLFIQISEGLDLIIEHMHSIEADVKYLSEQNKKCGFNIREVRGVRLTYYYFLERGKRGQTYLLLFPCTSTNHATKCL